MICKLAIDLINCFIRHVWRLLTAVYYALCQSRSAVTLVASHKASMGKSHLIRKIKKKLQQHKGTYLKMPLQSAVVDVFSVTEKLMDHFLKSKDQPTTLFHIDIGQNVGIHLVDPSV